MPAPAIEDTRAWTLFNELPATAQHRRVIAQAFIDELGDIPAEVAHSFTMCASDSADASAALELVESMRAQHFARLGRPVPEYRVRLR